MRGHKKLKYYNPFNVKLNDFVEFSFWNDKKYKGKIIEIDYHLLLVKSNYETYLIYIGQINNKLLA